MSNRMNRDELVNECLEDVEMVRFAYFGKREDRNELDRRHKLGSMGHRKEKINCKAFIFIHFCSADFPPSPL